jgi:hypothetical protein
MEKVEEVDQHPEKLVEVLAAGLVLDQQVLALRELMVPVMVWEMDTMMNMMSNPVVAGLLRELVMDRLDLLDLLGLLGLLDPLNQLVRVLQDRLVLLGRHHQEMVLETRLGLEDLESP